MGDIVYLQLDQPVVIDGTQNIWVMFYQDGSVEYPAPAMDDMGDPNSRWTGAQGMWFDLAQFASGYSWLLWAIADDETVLGETNNNMAVYPNPTTGNVTVSAPSMSHVSVTNTLGQVVYDANVSGNSLSLDLGQYQAGIYMVRVESANGVSVKRVNVVK